MLRNYPVTVDPMVLGKTLDVIIKRNSGNAIGLGFTEQWRAEVRSSTGRRQSFQFSVAIVRSVA